jgi:DNA-binding NtrC family response regulator
MKNNPQKTKSILVVDDEEVILRLLTRFFTNSAYDLVIANSIKDGIEKLDKCNFQLLLTDLRMPDGNGTELIRRFNGKFPASKVIVMTGSLAPEEDMKAVADIQISACVAKPFDLNVLRGSIAQALGD